MRFGVRWGVMWCVFCSEMKCAAVKSKYISPRSLNQNQFNAVSSFSLTAWMEAVISVNWCICVHVLLYVHVYVQYLCVSHPAGLQCCSLTDAIIILSDHWAASCIFEECGACVSISGRAQRHYGDWRLSQPSHQNVLPHPLSLFFSLALTL